MVGKEFLSSAIRFRMNINNTQIASTTSQPLNSKAHSEASIKSTNIAWHSFIKSATIDL